MGTKTAKWYKPWLAELKVLAASGMTFVAGLGLGILSEVQDGDLPLPGPGPVQTLILALVPTALTYLAGWKAKHTPREVVTGE